MKKSALMITAAAIIAAGSFGTVAALANTPDGTTQGSERGVHRHIAKHKFGGRHLETLADLLGMSTEELREQKSNGVSLKELLEQNGITREDVHLAMRENFEARLAQRVVDGDLTQEQADAKLAHMDEKHIALQNGEFDGHRHFHRHGKKS